METRRCSSAVSSKEHSVQRPVLSPSCTRDDRLRRNFFFASSNVRGNIPVPEASTMVPRRPDWTRASYSIEERRQEHRQEKKRKRKTIDRRSNALLRPTAKRTPMTTARHHAPVGIWGHAEPLFSSIDSLRRDWTRVSLSMGVKSHGSGAILPTCNDLILQRLKSDHDCRSTGMAPKSNLVVS